MHFLRNALDHIPRKADDDCLRELRWPCDRRDIDGARADLVAWLTRWQTKYPRLTDWVEEPSRAAKRICLARLQRA